MPLSRPLPYASHRHAGVKLSSLARGLPWLVMLAGLCACSSASIVEDTPMAVTIRYDGVIETLDDATAAAQTACAAHGKNAQLTHTDTKALLERLAHFACV
jgi:hypothetical protein